MKTALCVIALLLPGAVFAATCAQSVGSLPFGTYVPGQPQPVDAISSIRVQCKPDAGGVASETVSYSISILRSSNGQYSPRALQADGAALNYNLYSEASRALIWGDGSDGTTTVSGQLALPGVGSSLHTVYGRLFGAQSVPAGSYGDSVQVLLEY